MSSAWLSSEVLRWDPRVVDDRQWLLMGVGRTLEPGALFQLRRQIRLALEHGIEPLDPRDGHLRGGADRVRGQPLDVVQLGEPAIVVGRPIVRELLLGLLAEVGPVDEEQHAARPGELDEPVERRDGQHGLAAARRHLDERARPVLGQRSLEVSEYRLTCGSTPVRVKPSFLASSAPTDRPSTESR